MLQLLILEEFSNQSNRFATYGSILLSQDKLRELCTEAKLPKTSLAKVMCGWTKGDNLSKAFLMIDGDEYALSPEHMRVSYFLEHQGILRNSGSESGKKSAASKRKVYME